MKDRLIAAAVFVPLLFIVLFFLPPYALCAVMCIVCAVSSYEFLRAVGLRENERITIYAVFASAVIPVGMYFDMGGLIFTAVFLILMCLLFAEAINVFRMKRQISFMQITAALFGGALMPYMLSSLVSLKNMPEGRLLVLLPVICAFVTDAGAYFAGVLFGKRRAFPLISPKKTVEGYIGGLAAGTAAMIIYGVIIVFATLLEVRFWALILYGIVGGVVCQLGDLAFSMIKREFDIKDYGRLLPGHGGMLDRFDSMVFTAPAIHVLVAFIPAIIVR